jgi:hypothetical protein
MEGQNDSGSPSSVFIHKGFVGSPLPTQFNNVRPGYLHNASVPVDEVMNEFVGMKFHSIPCSFLIP